MTVLQRLGQALLGQIQRDTRSGLYVTVYAGRNVQATHLFADNEFTQLMKGLQGERLRQAFKYFDKDEDGFIRPEQFKRIIMVRAEQLCLLH